MINAAQSEDKRKPSGQNGKSSLMETILTQQTKSLIGLEYIVELADVETFYCILCENTCDLGTISTHIVSHCHTMKYLVRKT